MLLVRLLSVCLYCSLDQNRYYVLRSSNPNFIALTETVIWIKTDTKSKCSIRFFARQLRYLLYQPDNKFERKIPLSNSFP